MMTRGFMGGFLGVCLVPVVEQPGTADEASGKSGSGHKTSLQGGPQAVLSRVITPRIGMKLCHL